MFFYNEVEQWNNVSDSDLVQASSEEITLIQSSVNSHLTVLKLTEFLAFIDFVF